MPFMHALQEKEVGVTGHKYKIQCIKEEEYVMKLFIINGSLSKLRRKMLRTNKNRGDMVNKRVFYPEPIYIPFLWFHQIDDHNRCRHQSIGPENV